MSIAEIEEVKAPHEIKVTAGRKGRAKPRKGGGASDPNLAVEFVARIENLHEEIAKEKSAFMLICKGLQESIRDVLEEAQTKGLPKKPLRAIVKQRALEKKARGCRDDLDDIDHLSAFDIMKNALGDLADLPLGAHVLGPAH